MTYFATVDYCSKSKISNQHLKPSNSYASTINTIATQIHSRKLCRRRRHHHHLLSSLCLNPLSFVAMTMLVLQCNIIHVAFAFHPPIAFSSPSVLIPRATKGRNIFLNSSHKKTSPQYKFRSTREDVDGEISSPHSSSSSNNNNNNNNANDPVFEDVDGIGKLTNVASVGAVGTVGASSSIEFNVNDLIDNTVEVASIQDIASAATFVEEEKEVVSDNKDVFNIDNIISDATVVANAAAATATAAAAAVGSQTPTDTQSTETSNNGNTKSNTNNTFDNINISNPNPDAIVDILNISDNSDTQTQELIDPTAVVQGIIGGTALKDLDESIGGDIGVDTPTSNTDTNTSTLSSGDDDNKDPQVNVVSEKEEDLLIKSYNEYQGIEEVVQEQVQQIIQKNDLIDDKKVKETIDVPNMAKIIKFAIPAVGVWLCSPLLSLIDTSSVGLLSGTAQQAALNPAVAVTDYSAMLCAFMYTATTNLVAGAKGKEEAQENTDDHSLTKKTLIQALQVSGYVGVMLGSFLISFAPILLRTIIGNDSIDPQVFSAALRYVRIRALGMPAAVIIGSAQSASLGLQDIKSPMYVLLAAAIVNLLGDIIFVPQNSAWLGGAAGAAWATVFSQYAALVMFFKWMTGRPKRQAPTVNLTKAILELTGKSDEGKSRRRKFRRALQKLGSGGTVSGVDGDKRGNAFSATTVEDSSPADEINNASKGSRRSKLVKKIKQLLHDRKNSSSTKKDDKNQFTVRGFLAGEEKMLMRFPSLEEAKLFWPYFIPVTTTSVGRISSYIAMSHVVSSTLGTLNMAANQVILSVFYCLTPVADSLNLTAQSFVPAIAQRKKSLTRAKAIREITNNFIKAGLLFSVGMVGAIGCLPFVSKYFTSDPAVIPIVNALVPALSGFFAAHGVVCALEGEYIKYFVLTL